MVSDVIYDLCLSTLQDTTLEDEEKTEKLEELVRNETSLAGKPLEDAVLTILWQFRDSVEPSKSAAPVRHTVIRKSSPAPWQAHTSSPLASPSLADSSSAGPSGLGSVRPGFVRGRSFNASPFTSPRPSPRLAFASHIPHSPTLSSYEFSEPGVLPNDYGDFGGIPWIGW